MQLPDNKKARNSKLRAFLLCQSHQSKLALACFKAWISFINNIDSAFTTYYTAVLVAFLGRFE